MKWIQNTEEQQQQQRKKNKISSEFAFYFFVHQSIIIITHVAHVELCKKKKKILGFLLVYATQFTTSIHSHSENELPLSIKSRL